MCDLLYFETAQFLPEAGVCVFRCDDLLANLLQGWHPAGCEMTVLQNDPVAVGQRDLDQLLSYWTLTLTERDRLGLTATHAQVICKLQQS